MKVNYQMRENEYSNKRELFYTLLLTEKDEIEVIHFLAYNWNNAEEILDWLIPRHFYNAKILKTDLVSHHWVEGVKI